MSFNQTAVDELISNVVSGAQQLGIFEEVLTHEPKSKPQKNMTMAFWLTSIKPSAKKSGLASTAGCVTFNSRIYISFLAKPEDQVEANLLTATSTLISQYSSAFSFGGTVIDVDLLGSESAGLSAQFGYVEIGGTNFRTSNIVVPVIIDNLWTQEA